MSFLFHWWDMWSFRVHCQAASLFSSALTWGASFFGSAHGGGRSGRRSGAVHHLDNLIIGCFLRNQEVQVYNIIIVRLLWSLHAFFFKTTFKSSLFSEGFFKRFEPCFPKSKVETGGGWLEFFQGPYWEGFRVGAVGAGWWCFSAWHGMIVLST